MIKLITDSSALILLAKCSLLETVCNLFEVIAPVSVINEVASEDLLGKYPDASVISSLVSGKLIKTREIGPGRFQFPLSLDRGEEDALLLALELGNSILATDDGKAIKAARFSKVPFIITPRIVIDLFRLQRITFEKARQSIEKLAKIGRYSPEIIAEAILALMEEKDVKAHNHKDPRRPPE